MYNTLSPTRKLFVDHAHELFPDLNGQINRDQIKKVCAKFNLNSPQWLLMPENKVSRGVFKIPTPEHHEYVAPHQETDEEIEVRIADTYESMESLVQAVASNTVNSLIIAGAAGLGKSHTVNKVLQDINSGEYGYIFHKGYLRASHLFRMLWENRHAGMTVVIDDCDAIFTDEVALNMLKAALEMKPVRRIGWGSEKIFEDQDGEEIPRYFDFMGSVIFLTNKNIHEEIASNNKNSVHLAALESRSLILDLGIKTKREYMIKIKQTIKAGMLRDQGITQVQENEIMDFIVENADGFRELSLRMVEKVSALFKANPSNWKKLVRSTCMSH